MKNADIFHLGDFRSTGLPRWDSDKKFACQCWRHKRLGFDAWVGKIPWGRKWQPNPTFFPRKFHGPRSLAGWGCKELNMIEQARTWFCKELKRYCYMYSLRWNWDPGPRLQCCFLAAPPSSSYPLPVLISNCLNLPFGTQGRSRRLESIPYK